MGKRGPKKKEGARYKCGRLKQPPAQPVDHGPVEVQVRRAGLNGETDNPLPRLVRDGVITNVQAEAAEMYARAHIRLWGRQAAPAARYEEYIPGDGPTEARDQMHRYATWQRAYSAIIVNGGGWPAYSALRIVVLEWRPLPDSRLPALRLALDALASHYCLRKAA